jgi:dihydrofolate synthase/folylpolyglutamate synthase
MRADRYCVIADDNPPQSLSAAAAETGARPVWIARDFGVDDDGLFIRTGTGVQRFHRRGAPQLPEQSLLAAIQAVALAGFTPCPVDVDALYSDLRLPGRFQQLSTPRRTLLDVAHNPDAAMWLADRLAACKSGECHAVVGVYADKDYNAMLKSLVPLVDRWYPSNLDDPRAVAAADLADCVVACGGSVAGTYGKVSAAYDDALNNSTAADLILVFGSFLTVGGVLDYLHVPV